MKTEPLESRDEVEEAAAAWIARRGDDDWNGEVEAQFEAWLAESVAHRAAYYRQNAVWSQAGRLTSARLQSRQMPFAVAASLLVALAGTLLAARTRLFAPAPAPAPAVTASAQVQPLDPPGIEPSAAVVSETPAEPESVTRFQERYRTAVGATGTHPLPDGSTVSLDTDSEVHVLLDGRSRVVRLDRGQAFFAVAHDPDRPFVVHAGRLDVTAVGTGFSVRRDSRGVRVVVAEGTVRLDRQERRSKATPAPDAGLASAGEIAQLEGGAMMVRQVDAGETERNLSWRNGQLTFRHERLADAVAEFNRYGRRKLAIRDPAIGAFELGGVFRSTDIEAFVQLLEKTFPVDATVLPDRIELSARRPL